MKTGFVSDVHGNLEALEIGLRLLRRLGATEIIFLGDAVGYLPGVEAIDILASEAALCLRGNHEAMLLGDLPVSPAADEVYQLGKTHAALTPVRRQTIEKWPERVDRTIDGITMLLVHGSPARPLDGYIYPDTALNDSELAPGTVVFMGHSHRPFYRQSEHAQWVNVGSCGLPRDAGGLGSACIFDTETRFAHIVRFDIREATHRAFNRVRNVHPSVVSLLTRPRPSDLIGKIYE